MRSKREAVWHGAVDPRTVSMLLTAAEVAQMRSTVEFHRLSFKMGDSYPSNSGPCNDPRVHQPWQRLKGSSFQRGRHAYGN